MDYENIRCQTGSNLAEITTQNSKCTYNDLKYVKKTKALLKPKTVTTTRTYTNVNTCSNSSGIYETEPQCDSNKYNKINSYLDMRNHRIKSGLQLYTHCPKLVKYNKKEKNNHFPLLSRPQTSIKLTRGIDENEKNIMKNYNKNKNIQCDISNNQCKKVIYTKENKINNDYVNDLTSEYIKELKLKVQNRRNKSAKQMKNKNEENKYIKEIINKVCRKITYLNQHQETIYEADVMNLLMNEANEINERVDKNMEAFCEIRNFSIVMKEKDKKENVYLIPFINRIIKPYLEHETKTTNTVDKGTSMNNNYYLHKRIGEYLIKKNLLLEKEKKDDSLSTDKYHDDSSSDSSIDDGNVYNNLLANFVKKNINEFISNKKDNNETQNKSLLLKYHHKKMKKSKSLHNLIPKNMFVNESSMNNSLNTNKSISNFLSSQRTRSKRNKKKIMNLKSTNPKVVKLNKGNSIKDFLTPTTKISSLINQLAGNHKSTLNVNSFSSRKNYHESSKDVIDKINSSNKIPLFSNRESTFHNDKIYEPNRKASRRIQVENDIQSINLNNNYTKTEIYNSNHPIHQDKELKKAFNDDVSKSSSYHNTENNLITNNSNTNNKINNKHLPKTKFKSNFTTSKHNKYVKNKKIKYNVNPHLKHQKHKETNIPEITNNKFNSNDKATKIEKPFEKEITNEKNKKIINKSPKKNILPIPIASPITLIPLEPRYIPLNETITSSQKSTRPVKLKNKVSTTESIITNDKKSSTSLIHHKLSSKLSIKDFQKIKEEKANIFKSEDKLDKMLEEYKQRRIKFQSQKSIRIKSKNSSESEEEEKEIIDNNEITNNKIKYEFKYNTDISKFKERVNKLKEDSIENYIKKLQDKYISTEELYKETNSMKKQERINEFIKMLILSMDKREEKRKLFSEQCPPIDYTINNQMGPIAFPLTQFK